MDGIEVSEINARANVYMKLVDVRRGQATLKRKN
jgi:hypothetical protein